MKQTGILYHNFMNRPYRAYPNAATRRQVMDKILDRLLITACCFGSVITLAYLFFVL